VLLAPPHSRYSRGERRMSQVV